MNIFNKLEAETSDCERLIYFHWKQNASCHVCI